MQRILLNGLSQIELEGIGSRLSAVLFPGAFIALFGGLGAGKTTFTRAVAQGLDIYDIQSPTFTIVREHEGKLVLFHFDAYRLADSDELFAIGFDDYLARNAVIILEWSENVTQALPHERLDIAISGSGSMPRNVEITAHGLIYEDILEVLS
ncbi:MAG: tRNA (adenosine(37)-N6)-threonylcarbamoyltransferase complex ATPase subunit type 1 TsaE [Clostridia bacterium]